MTYFQNHPQRYTQHRYPRRGGGYTAPQITLHTYEAPHTRSLEDAARWLTQRRDPGSYHALAGARGPRDVLLLAPWSHETWHSVPSNNWSIGISAVAYAHQWKTIPRAAADNLVKSMAYAASLAAKWLEQAHGRKVEPRVLTRAQAMRKESGFVTHATMDPGRRSDPGRDFPMADFLAEFNRLMAGGSTNPREDWLTMPSTEDLEKIARAVWSYRNDKLETSDAYMILRRIRDRAQETRDLVAEIHTGDNRIRLTGAAASMFDDTWRAGALDGYAAMGGFQTEDRLIAALAEELGTSTDTILAAISRVLEDDDADVELPDEDDDTTTDNGEDL